MNGNDGICFRRKPPISVFEQSGCRRGCARKIGIGPHPSEELGARNVDALAERLFPKMKQAEVRATFFVRNGEIWERFDEIHTERGYGLSETKAVLKSTGFKTVKAYECLKFSMKVIPPPVARGKAISNHR